MKKLPKIAFTGPECSGKTTLAKWLSLQWDCDWSSEYARQYLATKKKYEYSDLDIIAQGQYNSNLLYPIADTEMLVMEIWSKVKFFTVSEKINRLIQKQTFDFYFLCKPDFRWEEDPLRENPNDREQLFKLYVQRIKELNWPHKILEGSLVERQRMVVEKLEKLF